MSKEYTRVNTTESNKASTKKASSTMNGLCGEDEQTYINVDQITVVRDSDDTFMYARFSRKHETTMYK
jgi:hypothetical protein